MNAHSPPALVRPASHARSVGERVLLRLVDSFVVLPAHERPDGDALRPLRLGQLAVEVDPHPERVPEQLVARLSTKRRGQRRPSTARPPDARARADLLPPAPPSPRAAPPRSQRRPPPGGTRRSIQKRRCSSACVGDVRVRRRCWPSGARRPASPGPDDSANHDRISAAVDLVLAVERPRKLVDRPPRCPQRRRRRRSDGRSSAEPRARPWPSRPRP